MCVAVLVETEDGPTAEELFQMEDSNPHGAGLAWASGDLIRYKKGLTWQQVRDLLAKIPRPALLHFRWATHGGRARHLSHPFPIGARAITSRKLNSASKAVVIHNGVWNDYMKFAPPGLDTSKWSDTAIAAYAAGVFGEEILDHVDWSTAVGRNAGHGRMDVTLRGDWYEHNGNQYSNLYWQPMKRYYSRGLGLGGMGGAYYSSVRGYIGGGWDDPSEWTPPESVVTIGEALARGYGSNSNVQPSHSAYDVEPTDIEDLPNLIGSTCEPRWRGDGKLISLGEPVVRAPELQPEEELPAEVSSWLTEEFAAVQRALGGEDK